MTERENAAPPPEAPPASAPASAPARAHATGRTPLWSWVLLALVVAGAAAIRWHRLGVPLERDEGEYAYAGRLILQGHPPYEGAYNMKLPGIYVTYAVVMLLFGVTVQGIHLGLLVVNAASIVLVHRIARRVLDDVAAVAAAATFAAATLHPAVTGLFANSEHFVVLPALGGILLLLRAADDGRARLLFAAGLLTGFAFTVKQHGIAFVALGFLLLAADALRTRPVPWRRLAARSAWYALGAALPFAVICAWLAAAGVFPRFWFWTFTYAAEYATKASLEDGLELLTIRLGLLGGGLTGIWLLAATGLAATLWSAPVRRVAAFLCLFAALSAAAVCPGWLFRDHYFLLLLPAASVAAGVGVAAAARALRGRVGGSAAAGAAALLAGGAAAWAVVPEWDLLVRMSDGQVARTVYGGNPFPESLVIAEHVRERTRPDQTIAVIGSEPQIYFYAGRRAATGHIYTYALMEDHPFALDMQREMIREIEAARPAYVVFVGVSTSWLRTARSPTEIFRWAERYVAREYVDAGLVEIGPDGTTFEWNPAKAGGAARTENWIGVYRRRGE